MDAPPPLQRPLELEVVGGGSTGCRIRRHLAPRTAGIIVRSLPIEGNAHRMGGGMLYIRAGIDSGLERSRTSFRRGDVAFLPSAGGICFFTRDSATGPMAPIGDLDDPGVLDGAGPGDVLRLSAP